MQITIRHNHGVLVLRDAAIEQHSEKYAVAVGAVVSGGQTSRLFHATSFKPFPVGERMEWPLYGRTPRPDSDGNLAVDCCFC